MLVHEQQEEGKRDLPLYVLNNVEKCIKLIGTMWEMENVRVIEILLLQLLQLGRENTEI